MNRQRVRRHRQTAGRLKETVQRAREITSLEIINPIDPQPNRMMMQELTGNRSSSLPTSEPQRAPARPNPHRLTTRFSRNPLPRSRECWQGSSPPSPTNRRTRVRNRRQRPLLIRSLSRPEMLGMVKQLVTSSKSCPKPAAELLPAASFGFTISLSNLLARGLRRS